MEVRYELARDILGNVRLRIENTAEPMYSRTLLLFRKDGSVVRNLGVHRSFGLDLDEHGRLNIHE